MSQENITSINITETFPQLLHIPQPPIELFSRGNVDIFSGKKVVAVVGSRACSSYGKFACETIVGELAGFPVVVVSGLALGIDAIAHRAALRANIPTVAFPGSGLNWNMLYPREHQGLAREILKHNGCLVSEFENNFQATPWTFPKRNRLVAGVADVVVVVEAKERSGALITARLGTEYGKTVMAVPGPIDSPQSKGTNWLLRLGATPATSGKDVLEELGLSSAPRSPLETPGLTTDERLVCELLEAPRTREELAALSGLDAKTLNIALSMLEVKGLIKEQLGKISTVVL